MPSALDTFRAQREAADSVYDRVAEVSALLRTVRQQADALGHDEVLMLVLQQEQAWLEHAQRTISELRAWREQEARRFWPAVFKRWMLALLFALGSITAAGAAYGRVARPYADELATLRSRAAFGNLVEDRLLAMTPGERRVRQIDPVKANGRALTTMPYAQWRRAPFSNRMRGSCPVLRASTRIRTCPIGPPKDRRVITTSRSVFSTALSRRGTP
jgi:hypothetical protein